VLELNIGMAKKEKTIYIRNFQLGVEDSLVSTVGLLAGLSSADIAGSVILVSGIVLIFVEAFSMGVGSFISEESVQEYTKHNDKFSKESMIGAFIMFFSYLISGLIPLSPYLLLKVEPAFYTSIVLTLFSLFALGAVSAYHFKHKDYLAHGIRTFVIGGMAAGVGILIGKLFRI